MTTINDLIVRAARDLNDYTDGVPNKQFQRWSQEQLLGYWNEALCVMYSLNPSKFKGSKVAKLTPGMNQVFSECKRVLSVIGVSDEDGNVLYEIEHEQGDRKLRWGAYRPTRCQSFTHNRDFKLQSYRILTDKDGSLMVKPAVPYGMDIHLKFTCETPPCEFKMNNLDADVEAANCIDIAMGVHWVLFRALMIDEESQSSTGLANQHLTLFFKLLDVKTETDKDTNYRLEGVPNILKSLVAREIAKYQLGVKQ